MDKEALKEKVAALIPKPTGDAALNDYQKTIKRYKAKVRNPKTAIRAHCIECSGGSPTEVTNCRVTGCALYPFRNGVNPFHSKTKARLEAMAGGGEDDEDDTDDEQDDESNDSEE